MTTQVRVLVQERAIITRRRLLSSARREFGRCGYETANSDTIAARAKCSKGALYYHFPKGKEALFEAVAEQALSKKPQLAALGSQLLGDLDARIVVEHVLRNWD